uniref:Replication factor C subunit 2 n=1 Tax=Lygus hesperus TaxID=30085 RepID=A0A0A9YK99_LYGHE
MELYLRTTRFALACNISSKILEPIQSRCAIVRFTRIGDEDIASRLRHVLECENVRAYDEAGIRAIVFTAQGDLRRALNNLQSTYVMARSVTAEAVFRIVDTPNPALVLQTVQSAYTGNLTSALQVLQALWAQGHTALDIVTTAFQLCKSAEINDRDRVAMIRELADTHGKLLEGSNSLLQLTALLARLSQSGTMVDQ